MEETIHKGEVSGNRLWNFFFASGYREVWIINQDHSSPGRLARLLHKILPASWMEKTVIGDVQTRMRFDPDEEVDLEDGDQVEVVVRSVEDE